MDWQAKKHIRQQLNLHCHRARPIANSAAQQRKEIKKHRETVVQLVEKQIGQCNCKFIGLIKKTKKCKETRYSSRICHGLALFILCVVVVYAALIYGAIVGAAQCSKDDFGCAQSLSAHIGIPGLRFKRNKQHGIM